ncbi:MAG: 5-(carboxyamino)imidazole ribonucleotide mutase [Candidatus Aminicenantes bacterium]|nr:5-(carboxyamino)imidazole ribonucleotide mutase [Candidatus Aminicenantes bacterium]
MKAAIFIGSDSDFDIAQGAVDIFKEFEIGFQLEVTSAHRSPERTENLIRDLEEKGTEVFIAVAGKAAHLAGMVAAHTQKPVIGVPVGSATLGGLDALLSTVQMPKGIPVACMGIGKSGAINAALLVVEILSLKDKSTAEKLSRYRQQMAENVRNASEKTKERI